MNPEPKILNVVLLAMDMLSAYVLFKRVQGRVAALRASS